MSRRCSTRPAASTRSRRRFASTRREGRWAGAALGACARRRLPRQGGRPRDRATDLFRGQDQRELPGQSRAQRPADDPGRGRAVRCVGWAAARGDGFRARSPACAPRRRARSRRAISPAAMPASRPSSAAASRAARSCVHWPSCASWNMCTRSTCAPRSPRASPPSWRRSWASRHPGQLAACRGDARERHRRHLHDVACTLARHRRRRRR